MLGPRWRVVAQNLALLLLVNIPAYSFHEAQLEQVIWLIARSAIAGVWHLSQLFSFFSTQKITMAAAGAVWGEYPADRGDQWL